MKLPADVFQFTACITLLSVTALFAETAGTKGGDEAGSPSDIVETVDAAGHFRTLIAAVKAAGLEETLKGGPITLLAPSDEAFDKLPPGTLESLLKPENNDKLRDILSYHILPARRTAQDLATRGSAETIDGYSLLITLRHPLTFNEKSKVARPDIRASNGIIHVIDQVLMPTDSPEWKRDEMRREELAELEVDLQGRGIEMDEEGIRKYLAEVTDWERDRADIKKLILQLGSDRFAERNVATRSLEKRNVLPVDLLREATRSQNLEMASRAKAILERYLSLRIQTIRKVFLAIEMLELRGLTDEICTAISRFHDAPGIVQPARRTLAAVVTDDDVPELSSHMTAKSVSPLRYAVVCALRQLEHADSADEFAAWAKDGVFAEITRLESALALADLGDRRSLGSLLGLMVEAKSPSVRARSARAMRTLTGQRFSFYAYAEPHSRQREAEVWKQWISANGETAPLNTPLRGIRSTGSPLNGQTLVALCGVGPNKVVLYDQATKEIWSYDSPYPVSASMMENGNYLIAQLYGPSFIEVTPEKAIVRVRTAATEGPGSNVANYEVDHWVNNAQPLPNGNFLVSYERRVDVGLGARAIEVDPQGEIVWELEPRWNSIGYVIRRENGNTLVVENKDADAKFVSEYDSEGKIVWVWESEGSIDSIQALGTGNVLICLRKTKVIELNPETRKVVWDLQVKGVRHAYRKDNGNVLIITNSRLMEVEPDGSEVWRKEIRTTSGSVRR